MTNSFTPMVLLHKTSLMQRLADCARHGYVFWAAGVVPLDRSHRLATKFGDLYGIGLSKDQRYRRKLEGRGNAELLLWREDESSDVSWFLMVTNGDHPARSLERLSDVRKVRITVTGYELVQQTRAGQARPAWTWRMSKVTYDGWRERVLKAVRQHADQELAQAWQMLHRAPGFAPVRAQVRKIAQVFASEWKRVRAGPFQMQRTRIPYISRVSHKAVPLRVLLQRPSEDTAWARSEEALE